ncbi:MAG: universal stress protein [Nitrospinota bacterium]
MAYKHIACVVDGSAESAKAQERAATLAAKNKSKLTYIFLADTAFLGSMATLTRGGKTLDAGMENVGNVLLDRAQKIASSKGVKCNREVLKGEETRSLEEELVRLGADVLVAHLEQGSLLLSIDKNDLESSICEIKERTGVELLIN